MSFHVLEESEHAFKIKHPDGSHFMVAKAGLDDKVMKKIKGYAHGTDEFGVDEKPSVEQELTDAGIPDLPAGAQVDQQQAPIDPMQAAYAAAAQRANYAVPVPSDAAGAAYANAYNQDKLLPPPDQSVATDASRIPAQQTPAGAPSQTPQTQPGSPNLGVNTQLPGSPYGQYGDVFKKQQEALGNLNTSTQDYLKSTNQAMKTYQDQQKAMYDSQQANLQKIQSDMDASKQAYMNGHLDPHRLWNQAGIGNKISAGIGLVLGGIGAGLAHTPNFALQIFDKMIDQDMESQRAEMDKNKSLFAMNMQRYGNQATANAATRLQLYNGLQAELQQKGMGLQSAQAQANYQMGMAGIQERMIPLQLQLASFDAMRQAGSKGLPANFPTERLPQDFQEKLVNVPGPGGMVKVPAQSKEAANDFRKSEVELNNIDSNLQNLKNVYQSVGMGSIIPGTAAHASLADASNAVKLSLGQLVNLKRINEYEAEKYEKMLPGPYSLNSSAAMAQIQQVENFIKNSRNASYGSLLNNYSPGGIKEGAPKVK